MSKGKMEIIETCCRRCGKSIRTLSHSIIGADDAREKFGSIWRLSQDTASFSS